MRDIFYPVLAILNWLLEYKFSLPTNKVLFDQDQEWEAPLLWNQLPVGFGKQTVSLSLGLGLKLSFLIMFIVGDGSGEPEPSHSYPALGMDCWGNSHDAPPLTPHPALFTLFVCSCHFCYP